MNGVLEVRGTATAERDVPDVCEEAHEAPKSRGRIMRDRSCKEFRVAFVVTRDTVGTRGLRITPPLLSFDVQRDGCCASVP